MGRVCIKDLPQLLVCHFRLGETLGRYMSIDMRKDLLSFTTIAVNSLSKMKNYNAKSFNNGPGLHTVVSHDFANLDGPDQNIKAEENIEKYHKTKEVIEGM